MKDYITIIGGGLAGTEAAYQIAKRGIKVKLYEMKPKKYTPAHSNKNLAEIVCSNSFKSNLLTNACGLLKEELRRLDSLLIKTADETSVPADQALAVDRERFAEKITESITQGGYFVGNIFGDRDEWRNLKKMCTFLTKEETLNLFEDFDIVYFEEVEKDGITGEGKTKHWHFFDVIAKKK